MSTSSQSSPSSGRAPRARPTGRTPFLIVALLAAVLLILGARGASAQSGCTGPAGETAVAVDLIRDGSNDPIIESSDTVRREYAHITSGLRDALGITVPADPDDDVRPQIRVIVETATLPSGLRSTASFTVESVIDDDSDLRVEVYDQDPGEGATDEDSGVFKLFEGPLVGGTTLTVHAAAPSRSEIYDAGLTTDTQNFCEPVENDPPDPAELHGVFESATIETARDFVLLVPHGGMIEEGTSEQVAEIEAAFATRGMVPSVWEATATWDGDMASERFHITSKATDPQAFPGLAQMLAAGDWDAASGIEFQHAASLHGFGSFNGHGIVFGGRAPQETKCYVARRIQQRFDAEGLAALAYYVYDSAGDPATALDLPDGGGVRITDQRPNVGLTGRSCENIVNRLTQGPGCASGRGGIQIEESMALRDDPIVRGLVSEEIALAFADMIEDPDLVDPAATVYCDALDSAATGGPGQIGDQVWVDLNGDGVQDPGEPGREGVTVELLDDGGQTVATAVTSANGRYLFGGLAEATYSVRVTLPAGFSLSPSGQGSAATDSDVLAGGETDAIVLGQGETRLDVDAGLVPDGVDGSIGDFVWQDSDGDGVHDPGEPGLPGVTIDLSTALGTPVATTLSDAQGAYAFTGLLPGDYVVTFTAAGWVATTGSTVGPFPLAADAIDESRDAGFAAGCEDYALVAFGSEWKYLPTGGVAAAGWDDDGFADGAWDSGSGLLGYSDSKTVHTSVPNFSDTVTYYFRHEFTVGDASLVQALDLELERDDGAIVYLNGQEVLRSNLPEGPIDAATRAVDSSWARVTATVDAGLLEDGPNLLAVEIHQRYKGSTADFAFDLELRAKSCNPCAVAVLELTPVADSYLRQDQPNTTKGGVDGLWADGGPGEGRSPVLAWDLSTAPVGETVLGVEILFEVTNDTSAYFPLHGLTTAWNEGQATWNHALTGTAWDAPGATGALDRGADVLGVAHAGTGPYTLSFTADGRQLVADWISGASANHGLIVAAGDSTNGMEVDSREGTTPPVLRVVHTTSCTP